MEVNGETYLPCPERSQPTLDVDSTCLDRIVTRTLAVVALGSDGLIAAAGEKALVEPTEGPALSARVSFPGAGEVVIRLRLHREHLGLDRASTVAWQIVDEVEAYRQVAGQYLLLHTDQTPQALRAARLSPRSIQRALTFRTAQSNEDYAAVLQLRHSAYSAVGKVDAAQPPRAMADAYDATAAILMATHGERLVGTARLALPLPHEPTEYDLYTAVPARFDRATLAALSRVATSPEYRGGDLLYALVLRSIVEASRAGRQIILGGCTDPLFPIYQRVGAQGTGQYFSHGALAGNHEQLLFIEPEKVLKGEGVRPDLWDDIVRPLLGRASDSTGSCGATCPR